MPDHEQRRTLFQRLCLGLLSLFGWTSVFEPLPGPKGVIMVYPHTSNWDFFIGILYRYGYGLRAHWMAKHSAFKWPIAGLLRRMGGIPIDRRRPGGAIATMCEEFNRRASMWVAITPEGTRHDRYRHLRELHGRPGQGPGETEGVLCRQARVPADRRRQAGIPVEGNVAG
jgi:1-acyl-sn-glycerol-3-phosphate acyltransferase